MESIDQFLELDFVSTSFFSYLSHGIHTVTTIIPICKGFEGTGGNATKKTPTAL